MPVINNSVVPVVVTARDVHFRISAYSEIPNRVLNSRISPEYRIPLQNKLQIIYFQVHSLGSQNCNTEE